ncbi:putative lipid II flippase FtsW [Desulfothermus okinawensis JCM 13304]
MVFSASSIYATSKFNNPYYFIKKQSVFFIIGCVTIYLVSKISTNFFYATRYVWLLICLTLIVLTLTSFGIKVHGASRWIPFLGFSLQPMEFSKIFLTVYFAWFFGEKQEKIKKFSIGFLPPILVTSLFALLLIFQPDFGGAVFVCGIFLFMSLIGGTKFLYWISSLFLFIGSAIFMVITSPYRLMRWKAFLHPFEHAQKEGYQLVQSIYGLANGGINGVGLGFGKQKLFFLPEAHTDFILSVLGEELGFLGLSLVFLCIIAILYMGMRLSVDIPDIKDKFLVGGITFVIVFSAFLNMSVVLGMIPPKGLAMPFLSYGGSNFLAMSMGMGLILSAIKKNVSV